MSCYYPLTAYRSPSKYGQTTIEFSSKFKDRYEEIKLPCGRCIGCRLDRSRKWAIRCMHEAQMYENNCFITLTFNQESLEERENPWSLDVKDFQLFMKRLRKKYGKGIRFYHAGEYGTICFDCGYSKKFCGCEQFNAWIGRPHYHACLFNHDFSDKKLFKITDSGSRLYISDSLSELWPYGFSSIGEVTFESAAYVARYIMKKITGDMADTRYFDRDGVVVKPEYNTMSRRPGIGKPWLDKYKKDVYPHDYIIIHTSKGPQKLRPPRFYDENYKLERPYEFDDIVEKRIDKAKDNYENNTVERLSVREKYQKARLDLLPREKI